MFGGLSLVGLMVMALVGCGRAPVGEQASASGASGIPDVKAVPVYFAKQLGKPAPPACSLPYESAEAAGWEEWRKVLVELQLTPSGHVEREVSVRQVAGQALDADTLEALATCARTTRLEAGSAIPAKFSFRFYVRPR